MVKKVAVVGAGLAGLAVAYFLRELDVTLFDVRGLGGGASGVASGLLHPYPGKSGKRSLYATDALSETIALLDMAESSLGRPVAKRDGIEKAGELIEEGITVFIKDYLEGLFKASGARLVQGELEGEFDHTVIATGAYGDTLDLGITKGQVLVCKSQGEKRSRIENGYLAITKDPSIVHIGSTYERDFVDDAPDPDEAIRVLSTRFPKVLDYEVVGSEAGLRASRRGGYLPYVRTVSATKSLFVGLGSRGLLYHAYFGKKLAKTILSGDNIFL